MRVKNDNFFDVGVSKLAMQLSYMLIIVYNQSVPQTIHVPLRFSKEVRVFIVGFLNMYWFEEMVVSLIQFFIH